MEERRAAAAALGLFFQISNIFRFWDTLGGTLIWPSVWPDFKPPPKSIQNRHAVCVVRAADPAPGLREQPARKALLPECFHLLSSLQVHAHASRHGKQTLSNVAVSASCVSRVSRVHSIYPLYTYTDRLVLDCAFLFVFTLVFPRHLARFEMHNLQTIYFFISFYENAKLKSVERDGHARDRHGRAIFHHDLHSADHHFLHLRGRLRLGSRGRLGRRGRGRLCFLQFLVSAELIPGLQSFTAIHMVHLRPTRTRI